MIMIPKHRAYVLIFSAAAFCFNSLSQVVVPSSYFGEEQVVHGTGTASKEFRRRLSTIDIYAFTWNQLVANQNMPGTLGYGVIPESPEFYRKLDKKVREREKKYAEANAANKLLYTERIWRDNYTDNNWNADARGITAPQLLVPIDRSNRIQARNEIAAAAAATQGIPT